VAISGSLHETNSFKAHERPSRGLSKMSFDLPSEPYHAR
jgi:hypothetical protein